MRHNFLVVTVKKELKSVYIYRSYYKNKLGGPFFWNTLYTTCCLHGVNFHIILDKGVMTGNYVCNKNFIYRMLLKDCYYLCIFIFIYLCITCICADVISVE